MRHIVVLGAGFAGLSAINALEQATLSRRRIKLTLVSDSTHFLFTPLLPNVANAELSLKSITLPLREQLDESTALIIDRVTKIDTDAQVLHTTSSRTIPYDYLLIAPGTQTNWRGHEDWRPFAMTCKESRDAIFIREHTERAIARAAQLPPADRAGALTFVFAGAGPTGIELAAELHAGLERDVFPRANPDLVKQVRFIVTDPGDTILPGLPGELADMARTHLEQKGIEIHTNTQITARDAARIELDGGDDFACEHLFWCAGVKTNELVHQSGFELDAGGRILTDSTLQAMGHENIFVAGDCAAPPMAPAQNAQAAKQQGPLAAHNMLAALSGRSPKTFEFQHLGDLLTLGRGHAAIRLMGMSLEGRIAYAMYRAVYAGLMPGAMKKVQILAEWFEHDLATAQLLSLPNLQD